MRNIKLTIEYDGTHYHGWQMQNDLPTIQGRLQQSIKDLTKEKVTIYGSGRTDAGVHARAQVANFRTKSSIPDFAFAKALNSKLPPDIAIKESQQVDNDFHAQYACKAKAYSYRIICTPTKPAIERNYLHWVWFPVDVEFMRQGSRFFVGKHDFSAFEAANSPRKSNIRTVNSIDIRSRSCYIEIIIEANGFLYRMVRNIVGTLIEVGRGQYKPYFVERILESKDRTQSGPTVPARGLCLEYVVY